MKIQNVRFNAIPAAVLFMLFVLPAVPSYGQEIFLDRPELDANNHAGGYGPDVQLNVEGLVSDWHLADHVHVDIEAPDGTSEHDGEAVDIDDISGRFEYSFDTPIPGPCKSVTYTAMVILHTAANVEKDKFEFTFTVNQSGPPGGCP